MAKNNRNNNPDDFPLSTDPEFNSVVMENEMTGAIPVISEKNQGPYGIGANEVSEPVYGESEDENLEPPYGRSKGKGKGAKR